MAASWNILRATRTTGRIRVLIVDDSLVIRHLLREALSQEPAVEIVGAEANGAAALAVIPTLKPDVVTLDIEMPVMDGLETLRRIRKDYPLLRVVMFSTLTSRGAAATFEALALGADDYVAKAANAGSLDRSLASLRQELIPKIKQFFAPAGSASTPKPAGEPAAVPKPQVARQSACQRPKVVAIGVSTGGPQALARLMPRFPRDFPLPMVIVQHMPPMFTRLLAEQLTKASSLPVFEAEEGMRLEAGKAVLAPGDYHLRVRNGPTGLMAALDQGPHENSCRPAVDVLFRSLADTLGGAVLPVILTGMGSDGLKGTRQLVDRGARAFAQDEATSVVWGMPGAIVGAGLAERVLPLDQMAEEIVRRVRH